MPFQAPHYIYPTPETPDYAGAIQSGISMGQKIKSGRAAGAEIKRKRDLEKEIGDIYKDTQTKLGETDKGGIVQDATAGSISPDAAPPLTEAGSESRIAPTNPEVVNMTGGQGPPEMPASNLQGVAAKNANKEKDGREKAIDESKNKRLKINADMHNKIIGAHIKHGYYGEAEELKSKYLASVEKLAAIDPNAAEKVWNSSYLKDEYGEVELKSLKNEWSVTISKDGQTAITHNKRTNETRPVDLLRSSDQVKQLGAGDSLVMVNPKNGQATEIYKNSKPETDLGAEKTYIKARVAEGKSPDVAAKEWQAIKGAGKDGAGGKKTAFEKNMGFLKGLGLNDTQAMSYLEKGRQSKSQFVAGVYRDILRNEGSDVAGSASAQKAADQAGLYYDTLGGEASASLPSSGLAAKAATASSKQPPAGYKDTAATGTAPTDAKKTTGAKTEGTIQGAIAAGGKAVKAKDGKIHVFDKDNNYIGTVK